ncbi:MAG: hypothetical protein II167_04490 [Clostridiales bacterium]|nr:hypothetical protein [Clostridiales bacterium]
MAKYIFNARDVAAYFKWFGVPSYLEVSYMQYIFSIGSPVLANPLTRDFEKFKGEVYRELYYLWANGFEDERSDISCMPEDGARALICDQECINLESYMKLITLHLIFTKNLPYVKINFTGLPLQLGIRCDFTKFEENVVMAVERLNLVSKDAFGKPFDLSLGVPDELLSISLDPEFKARILKHGDFREALRTEQDNTMRELKEASLKVFGSIPFPKSRKSRKKNGKSAGETANTHTTSRGQPKGTPLQETRHKDGND